MSGLGWTEHFNEGTLPVDVACPTCGATRLSLRTYYREPDSNSIVRAQAEVQRHELHPCGHLLEHWEWKRETPDSPVVWTLVPLA